MNPSSSIPAKPPGIAEYTSVTLLGAVFLPVFVLALCLAFHMGETRWCLAETALLLSPLATHLLLKGSLRHALLALCLTAVFLLITCFISAHVYDFSYDGRTYDAGAILALLQGYNPCYQTLSAPYELWINHYPKATWYFASVIAHATGFFQAGKCYDLLLGFVVLFYAYRFFKPRLPQKSAVLFAIAAAANPIICNQAFSFYVDGAVAACVILLLLSASNLVRGSDKVDRLIFFMAGCLLINVKFSAFAYFLIVCAVMLAITLWQYRAQLMARIIDVAGVLIIGGMVIGYNPYLTNIITHGHPMYPLMGKGKVEVAINFTPIELSDPDMWRSTRLFYSLISRAVEHQQQGHQWSIALSAPFALHSDEMEYYQNPDSLMGGWGPWMSGIMLVSIVIYLLTRGWRDKEASILIITALCTIMINPFNWWARYVPQLAFLPLLFTLPAVRSGDKKSHLSLVISSLLLINSAILLTAHFSSYYAKTKAIDAQIRHIVALCGKGVYQAYGKTDFHYEPIAMEYGISMTSPIFGENSAKPAKGMLPVGEIFLYKQGCNNNLE